jgi:hypothetical protein
MNLIINKRRMSFTQRDPNYSQDSEMFVGDTVRIILRVGCSRRKLAQMHLKIKYFLMYPKMRLAIGPVVVQSSFL